MPTLPSSPTQFVLLASLAVVTVDLIRRFFRDRAEKGRHPLPPGPPLLPFLGAVLSLGNTDTPWIKYIEWAERYKSHVVYARFFDQDVIILNSLPDSFQLLEKRSQLYSDRPYWATVDPYGHGFSFVFQHYGDHWRLCRRIFHQTFRAEAAVAFRPNQLRRSRQMIVNLIEEPQSYPAHFSTFSGAVAMAAAWDYDPSPRNDPMVALADNFLHVSLPGLTPDRALLLKTFPFLLHVPDWFPGSWLKLEARRSRDMGVKMIDALYQYVLDRMKSEKHVSGLVAEHVTRMKNFDEAYKAEYSTAIKHTSTTAFLGAAETTTATLMTFMLAMVENPHVWKRAQAQLDAVVGIDRLPDFEDRDTLPYVTAIFREVVRWHPAVPLGVPHAVIRSDIYKDYFIPKGATVFANIWAMSHDEARYPDADRFAPERFLDEKGMLNDDNPTEFVFGFGRRICPGKHTAQSTLWIAIATMLATLQFHRAKDELGNDVIFEVKFSNSLTHRPEIFPCRLIPRAHITKEALQYGFAN